jgi:hypothetical protein
MKETVLFMVLKLMSSFSTFSKENTSVEQFNSTSSYQQDSTFSIGPTSLSTKRKNRRRKEMIRERRRKRKFI